MTVHGEQSEPRTYVTRHGTLAVMNTANIGKTKPAHEPEPREQVALYAGSQPVAVLRRRGVVGHAA